MNEGYSETKHVRYKGSSPIIADNTSSLINYHGILKPFQTILTNSFRLQRVNKRTVVTQVRC